MLIRFTCNGEEVQLEAEPGARVIDLLRDELGLTGTKEGCGRGECGACTILLDGKPVNSCLLPAALLHGREVVTIEGLAQADGTLHPVQKAFVDAGAVQCGFCTPGMVLRAVAFLREHPHPTDEQIARAVEGNLCRCTGYVTIGEALRLAAEAGK